MAGDFQDQFLSERGTAVAFAHRETKAVLVYGLDSAEEQGDIVVNFLDHLGSRRDEDVVRMCPLFKLMQVRLWTRVYWGSHPQM